MFRVIRFLLKNENFPKHINSETTYSILFIGLSYLFTLPYFTVKLLPPNLRFVIKFG